MLQVSILCREELAPDLYGNVSAGWLSSSLWTGSLFGVRVKLLENSVDRHLVKNINNIF